MTGLGFKIVDWWESAVEGGVEVESKRCTSSFTRSSALRSPSSMVDLRWPAAEMVKLSERSW